MWERYGTPLEQSQGLQNAVVSIATIIEAYVRTCANHWPVLAEWRANNVAIQRYGKNDGISRHRDFTKDIGLNVVMTIQGRSIFEVFHSKEGPPWLHQVVRPGSLVLLRATNLLGADTVRPYHQVSGAQGGDDRIALILRYERKVEISNVYPLQVA